MSGTENRTVCSTAEFLDAMRIKLGSVGEEGKRRLYESENPKNYYIFLDAKRIDVLNLLFLRLNEPSSADLQASTVYHFKNSSLLPGVFECFIIWIPV